MGALFVQKFNINLQSDILDTPDVVYAKTILKPWYASSREYLEIDQRAENINRRLEVLTDLYELLMDEQEHKSGTKLEWIVIYLIFVEIIVGLLPYIIQGISYFWDSMAPHRDGDYSDDYFYYEA